MRQGAGGSDPRCDDRSTDRFVAAQAATNRGRYRQPADPSQLDPACPSNAIQPKVSNPRPNLRECQLT